MKVRTQRRSLTGRQKRRQAGRQGGRWRGERANKGELEWMAAVIAVKVSRTGVVLSCLFGQMAVCVLITD